jgi:hypothetical protein
VFDLLKKRKRDSPTPILSFPSRDVHPVVAVVLRTTTTSDSWTVGIQNPERLYAPAPWPPSSFLLIKKEGRGAGMLTTPLIGACYTVNNNSIVLLSSLSLSLVGLPKRERLTLAPSPSSSSS